MKKQIFGPLWGIGKIWTQYLHIIIMFIWYGEFNELLVVYKSSSWSNIINLESGFWQM